MTDLQQPRDKDASDDTGLTRRAIVRTAGKAAWAAPVIAVATAAPAMAASAPPFVTTSAVSGTVSGTVLTVTSTFTNSNTGGTTGMNVQVVLQPFPGTGTVTATVTSITGGFSLTSQTIGGIGQLTAVFAKTAPQISGSGGANPSATLGFSLTVTNNAPFTVGGGITATPTPTPGVGTPLIGSF